MDSKIRILSDLTINQIAAGEVIENPSSVVKELVENAIDAGASNIGIEILSGGFQSIKISDNGSGMSPDDATVCLERHATSKIVDANDLFSLVTMGFRGEALASIAAISKMTLLTALENAPAVLMEVEGGKVNHIGPGARSRGTTIEIRSLFYNVPARKKFQKSVAASSAEITKIVTQLALAHPETGFELVQQKRCQFSLAASAEDDFLPLLSRRIAVLLGEEFLQSSHPLEVTEGNYQVRGLIADPLFTRHNRSGQSVFVNRRPVFCPAISYAVRDAYGTRLSIERHPVYLLHLTIPPPLIDVNVHPQKKEIRLREESMLKYTLHAAINSALSRGQPSEITHSFCPPTPFFNENRLFMANARPDFSQPLILREETAPVLEQEIALDFEIQALGLYRHYLLVDAESFPHKPWFSAPGVIWVDLPAAEARLQFESLLRNLEKLSPVSQGLLIPLTLSYSRAESQLLKTHLDIIQKFGIQIREMGQTVFIVEATPPFLEEAQVKSTLEELLSEFQVLERERSPMQERNRRLASCICRRIHSRKKNYSLTEAARLLKQLLHTEDPFHCPQGKKTLFHVREEEIESYFTRKGVSPCPIETLTDRFERGRT